MANIAKVTQGALAKNKKLNEIIERLNPLLNIEVNEVEEDEPLEIEYSDNNVVLRVPANGGGGGGVPEGIAGDMLYHDGADWLVLSKPTGFSSDPILRHDGTAPYWDEPSSC